MSGGDAPPLLGTDGGAPAHRRPFMIAGPFALTLPLAIRWYWRPAPAMYPSGNRPSLWTEFWVLTRAVYGIILWPVLALVALILGLLGLFYLFATHWALGLLALGVLALAVGVFAWWDSHRPPPPYLRR